MTNVITIPGPSVSDTHVSCVTCPQPGLPIRAERNIRYSLFIRRLHFVLHTIHLILQASVFPFVCVPEECALRGEVRRDEMADLLAPVTQTLVLQQPLMAASLGLGHTQAVARAGTLKTSTYCWMKRRERKNDFILPVLLTCSFLRSVIRYVS